MKFPATPSDIEGSEAASLSPAEKPTAPLTLEQQSAVIGELFLHAARRLATDKEYLRRTKALLF